MNNNDDIKSLEEFNQALRVYIALGRKAVDFGVPYTYGNIGQVYISQGERALKSGNKEKARKKFEEALAILQTRQKLEEEGKMSSRVTYIQLGDCYFSLSDIVPENKKRAYLKNSREYYEKALEIAKNTANKALLMQGYSRISEVDRKIGDFKNAYENHTRYVIYKDSLNSESDAKKAVQALMQYNFDKKESLTKLTQQKKDFIATRTRNLQYAMIVFFLLVAVFLYINNRQKHKAKSLVEKAYAELKATQSQLIQSEKMASLGELTAGIAHEIQNPLNFVNNFSEVSSELIIEAEEEMTKSQDSRDEALVGEILSDIKQNLDKINHHGKRADAIVKGMLQHSRSSSGTKELTDINSLCDEYLRLSYHGLRAKDKSFNATLKTSFDPSIGKLTVVPQDLGRVILNLLTNAFYAVNEKKQSLTEDYVPTVSINTKKIGGKVEIRVSDNGNGIPKSSIDKIFQPFFTTKPTGKGTGLGLSMSYDIITKGHGGELKVETKENEFTHFIIILNS